MLNFKIFRNIYSHIVRRNPISALKKNSIKYQKESFIKFKQFVKFYGSVFIISSGCGYITAVIVNHLLLLHENLSLSSKCITHTKTTTTTTPSPSASPPLDIKNVNNTNTDGNTNIFDNKKITSSSDFEVDINNLIKKADDYISQNDLTEAKIILYDVLKKIEQSNRNYTNISTVYDLLAYILIAEGSLFEIENLLVTFIERLLLLGYPENHNSIIQFQLKLSRLYHIAGNSEMADIGFRNCIEKQEDKLWKRKREKVATNNNKNDNDVNNKNNNKKYYNHNDKKLKNNNVNVIDDDDKSNLIYLSTLFWYGRFLMEQNDFGRAKSYMVKAIKQIPITELITDEQHIVILYHAAEIAFNLKEYDESVNYLVESIKIAKNLKFEVSDLPVIITKLGIVFLYKGIYDKAKYWCNFGHQYAQMYDNKSAVKESTLCLEYLKDLKSNVEDDI